MALAAIDEAVRNLVAVGGDPSRVALLDNFCWGDPTKAERLGGLVRAVDGCVDGSRRYQMPFISGKDSLFNEFDGEPIPDTLLISAIGLVPDISHALTSAGSVAGDDIWLVGESANELGGSLVNEMLDLGSTVVPQPLTDPLDQYQSVHSAICEGLISAAHDCSEGGLSIGIAEMAIASRLGFDATAPSGASDFLTAFTNEATGRILLTSPEANRGAVAEILDGFATRIGSVNDGDQIRLRFGSEVVEVDLASAVVAYSGHIAAGESH